MYTSSRPIYTPPFSGALLRGTGKRQQKKRRYAMLNPSPVPGSLTGDYAGVSEKDRQPFTATFYFMQKSYYMLHVHASLSVDSLEMHDRFPYEKWEKWDGKNRILIIVLLPPLPSSPKRARLPKSAPLGTHEAADKGGSFCDLFSVLGEREVVVLLSHECDISLSLPIYLALNITELCGRRWGWRVVFGSEGERNDGDRGGSRCCILGGFGNSMETGLRAISLWA
ncbi:hypothetical protein J3F84DRAFT_93978 [Trichoderma pleuroticola]